MLGVTYGRMRAMDPWPTRLAKLRKKAGLSQVRAGLLIGVAGPSIAQWESGRSKPDPKNVPMAAAAYKVGIDEFCGDDIPRPPTSLLIQKGSKTNLPNEAEKAALYDLVDVMDEPQIRRALHILRALFLADQSSVA